MASSLSRYHGVRPRPAIALLRRLAELGRQALSAEADVALPRVRLDLADGHEYVGSVLGIDEQPGELSILFLGESGPTASHPSLGYLAAGKQFSVIVLDPERWAELLHFSEGPATV